MKKNLVIYNNSDKSIYVLEDPDQESNDQFIYISTIGPKLSCANEIKKSIIPFGGNKKRTLAIRDDNFLFDVNLFSKGEKV
jgi:hypothetical protein